MCVIKNVEPFIFAIDVEVLERTSSLPSGNYGKKKTIIKKALISIRNKVTVFI